ncbi:MAG: hypothetical protein KJ556_06990 [Gammaproteobacteria bacterium]|nr:hypothetical protein [Gammaproteobacteria bacterium]MBU2057253.1 hypothetical protein [Gammaproteobacteria bacterium]MBU2174855.1 hypothetical protein [Gammaproteobacteria bacterium]MBU2245460.1 hypothetical protein [Gammaproteobacteria bacterium]MBU2344240.1 hypothetical protein [Gammaproteobacteria bacterium]
MKNFKLTFALLTAGLLLPGMAAADSLSASYSDGKMNACKVTYKYYDGDKGKVTCTVTDSSIYGGAMNCSGNDEIRHTNHKNSAILISVTGSCGSTDYIASVTAKKTAGKDQSVTAKSFDGKNSYLDKNGVSGQIGGNLMAGEVNDVSLCYQRIGLWEMQNDQAVLRVKLNQTKTYDGHFGTIAAECNKVYDAR